MKPLIAIVDDEPDILNLVSLSLEKAGYDTAKFGLGKELFQFLKNHLPELIVLDLMLPDLDGFDICKDLKKDERSAAIPIIMLTAKGDVTDRVLGLEFGADDYIVKPFSPRELVARVKAVLRRGHPKDETSRSILIGNILEIDLQKYQVFVEDKKIELTPTEFKILELLVAKPGWVYSRNQILDYLWGNDKIVIDRTVDVHIRNLRDKLGNAGNFVKNVRSVGYKLEA
ncbi:MAG TPA: response regulator [Candidatus Cloacimonadota bacterium]|nr:response regulator [Candidatus Cloacimonadota bacterium]